MLRNSVVIRVADDVKTDPSVSCAIPGPADTLNAVSLRREGYRYTPGHCLRAPS